MLDILKWMEIPGWFNALEGQYLYETVLALPEPARIVEIGSFRGKSTVAILQACKDSSPLYKKKLMSIDSFSGNGATVETSTRKQKREGSLALLDTIKRFELMPWFESIVTMTSHEWFALIEGEKEAHQYDMFFVDGCHLLAGDDVQEAWRFLKKGGIILCHDYDPATPTSQVVVDLDHCGVRGAHIGVYGTSLWRAEK